MREEVRDTRSSVVPKIAVLGGLAIFLLFAVMDTNIISAACAGIGFGILMWGETVERRGEDATVVYRDRIRSSSVLWRSTVAFGIGFALSLIAGAAIPTVLLLIITGACGVTAFISGGGSFPFMDRDDDAPAPSEEERALRRISPRLFEEVGLTVKSRETGLMLTPEIIRGGTDSKGRPGFDAKVIPGHQTVDNVAARAKHIASAWGVPRVIVEEPEPHVARITAIMRDTRLTGPVVWQGHPISNDIVEYVSSLNMGAYVEDGEPFVMNLQERNFVIGGQPGAGKSSFTNALLAHLALHPDVRIAFVDLKDGVEAAPWDKRVDQIIESDDDDDDDDFDDLDALASSNDPTSGQLNFAKFLVGALRDMKGRYKRMKAAGVTNVWTEGFLGPDEPLKILVVDEIADAFLTDSKERAAMTDKIITALRRLLQKGRAAGYVIVMATQYPKEESLPNSIRQVTSNAIAFRVKDDSGTGAILGRNYAPTSPATDPSKILEETQKGQAVIVDKSGDAQRIQCAWLDKETKRQVVAYSAKYKRQWLDRQPKQAAPKPAPVQREQESSLQDEVDSLLEGLDLD